MYIIHNLFSWIHLAIFALMVAGVAYAWPRKNSLVTVNPPKSIPEDTIVMENYLFEDTEPSNIQWKETEPNYRLHRELNPHLYDPWWFRNTEDDVLDWSANLQFRLLNPLDDMSDLLWEER